MSDAIGTRVREPAAASDGIASGSDESALASDAIARASGDLHGPALAPITSLALLDTYVEAVSAVVVHAQAMHEPGPVQVVRHATAHARRVVAPPTFLLVEALASARSVCR